MDGTHRTYVLSVFDDILNLLNRLYEITDEDYVKLDMIQAELEITVYEKHNISDYDTYVLQKNTGTYINKMPISGNSTKKPNTGRNNIFRSQIGLARNFINNNRTILGGKY